MALASRLPRPYQSLVGGGRGNNRLKDVYLLAKIEEYERVAKNMEQRDLRQYL